MAGTQTLWNVQRWMQAVITHPHGVVAGIASADAARFLDLSAREIESVILPSKEMNSLDRLQIYGRAYYGRLIECLREQFPAVRHSLGEEAFDAMSFGYLIDHPSTKSTLGALGDAFDKFLSVTRPTRSEPDQPDFADFVSDLARLERTYGDVFHCEGPERSKWLKTEEFESLSAEGFADCRLVPYPCVRLVELAFPVHEYATAIRLGTEASIPEARPVHLVVTRRDYIVRRFEITPLQSELLSMLIRQATIAESLQLLCSHTDTDINSLTTDLRNWFRDWSAAPLFAKLERPLV